MRSPRQSPTITTSSNSRRRRGVGYALRKISDLVAIASTDTTDARDNIGDPSALIYRLDDTRIADDEADLFDGSIAAPLNIDEAGNTYQILF